ncbi:hypothetical protein Tco_0484876, partial [Tanacetum coccineum]
IIEQMVKVSEKHAFWSINLRPFPEFEEYVISISADTPYMILWSTPRTSWSTSQYAVFTSANTAYQCPDFTKASTTRRSYTPNFTEPRTAKIAEEQENVAAVQEKMLEEDVKKIVEGEYEESYANDDDDDDDDDDDVDKNKDDKKDDDNDDDDNDNHNDHALFRTRELTVTVSPTPGTTSQDHSKPTSNKTKALPGSIAGMSKRHELTIANTNELIKEAVLTMVNDAVKKDREISTSNVPNSSTTTTTVDLQHQLYLKMKSNLQDQVVDPELWDVLKHHDDHQEDDAPPEGEKRVERQKTSKGSKSASDEVIPEDETLDLIEEFHNVDKRVPTIYDHERMEATLRDMMSN